MKTLDLCSFPLDSLALIEASAGTGKTYAVANLYLRYLLERKCSVDEILVVTFTEAATQELRDRIRARIQDLSQVFEEGRSSDPVLQHLYQQSNDIEGDKLLLKLAERQIDLSEIHTIHGFCQQLLSRYALEINIPFHQTLMEDLKPLLKQACEDFWRQEVLGLPEDLLIEVRSHWSEPESLLDSIRPLISRRPEVCHPAFQDSGIDAWKHSHELMLDWYGALREKTLTHIDDVENLVAGSSLKNVKSKLKWLASIRAWCESAVLDFNFPKASKRNNLFEVFTPGILQQETKSGGQAPEHVYFSFLDVHLEGQPESSREVFLVQSYQLIASKVQELKSIQGVAGFDDLILSVANALGGNEGGLNDRGSIQEDLPQQSTGDKIPSALVTAVRERFSVALIDEFQDTDKAQYQIFSTLFAQPVGKGVNERGSNERGSGGRESECSMVLIGDPKQAIYAFRGGDIATYLQAKQDIEQHPRGHLFTMDTNWRSSPEMVSAVNKVFLGQANAFMAQSIPFHPVEAAKDSLDEGQGLAALRLSLLSNQGRRKEQLTSVLADHCVQQIVTLIDEEGRADSDIAVLVRSAPEAELIKQRLAMKGLGASYEGKNSVYESVEAQAIYVLLEAVAEPANEYAMMRCLSELFFLLDDEQLHDIKTDDAVLAKYLELFENLNRCWQRFGVLATIRKALQELGVYGRWHQRDSISGDASVDWERRLTNVNQIAELLQNKSLQIRGHFALLRWLRDNISASVLADDDNRLRLESDEQLIRIVTIHKSKGLEYPFVFIPFLFSARASDQAWFYDSQGRLNLDLIKQDANISKVESERLAEDIRLLYVALTRAKYRCYVGTTFYKGMGVSLGLAKTAWAYLVSRTAVIDGLDEETYRSLLESLAAQSEGLISFEEIDETMLADCLKLPSEKVGDQIDFESRKSTSTISGEVIDGGNSSGSRSAFSSLVLQRGLTSSWRVQSFTGLLNESHSHRGHLNSRSVNHRSESLIDSAAKELALGDVLCSEIEDNRIFDFPRGSKAGTFLHTLFENIDFTTAMPLASLHSDVLSLEEMVLEQLGYAKLVKEDEVASWAEFLADWLRKVLKTPLNQSLCLAYLPQDAYQSEMEFYFSLSHFQAARFNALLKRNGYEVPELYFSTFKGHLKGAIDLVFCHEEKYYLLDYKSNYLGSTVNDYRQEDMHLAMNEHRYDLQYLIYTLALHRYLQSRLGERYEYQRDFGGVYYLYLRGLRFEDVSLDQSKRGFETDSQRDGGRAGVFFTKPDWQLINELDSELGKL